MITLYIDHRLKTAPTEETQTVNIQSKSESESRENFFGFCTRQAIDTVIN